MLGFQARVQAATRQTAAPAMGDTGSRWKCNQLATAIPSTNTPTNTGMTRPT